jgi:heat shock protein HslJ
MRRSLGAHALLPLLALVAVGSLLAACASNDPTGSGGASSSAAQPAPELAGTGWTLASYPGPDGAQVPAVADPSVATLNFAEDGTTLSGSTGCNRFTGTYAQSGAELTITMGGMTLVGCVGPVDEQEKALVAALPKVAAVAAQGDRIALLDASGATLLVYAPGLASLEGTSWRASGINNGKGGVESNAQTPAVTAVFGEDGTLSGTGGCNQYTATYTVSGRDGLTVGPVAATQKACDEDVMATEAQYFAALEQVATYSIEGNQLTLRDADGATQVAYLLAD